MASVRGGTGGNWYSQGSPVGHGETPTHFPHTDTSECGHNPCSQRHPYPIGTKRGLCQIAGGLEDLTELCPTAMDEDSRAATRELLFNSSPTLTQR